MRQPPVCGDELVGRRPATVGEVSLVAAFASRFDRVMPSRRVSGSDSALYRNAVRFSFIWRPAIRLKLMYVVRVRRIVDHIQRTVVNAGMRNVRRRRSGRVGRARTVVRGGGDTGDQHVESQAEVRVRTRHAASTPAEDTTVGKRRRGSPLNDAVLRGWRRHGPPRRNRVLAPAR